MSQDEATVKQLIASAKELIRARGNQKGKPIGVDGVCIINALVISSKGFEKPEGIINQSIDTIRNNLNRIHGTKYKGVVDFNDNLEVTKDMILEVLTL